MKNYQNSEQHLENCRNAAIKGRTLQQEEYQSRISIYNNDPKLCKKCLNALTYEQRHNTFCSKSCAISFNNKNKPKTKEIKEKISNTLKGNKLSFETKEKISKNNGRRKKPFTGYVETQYSKPTINNCNAEFLTTIIKKKYCSLTCANKHCNTTPEARLHAREAQLRVIAEGRHKGWSARTKAPSYPEQYFIDLFNNEQITGWIREHKEGSWFIDFAFIDKKIALEIDGSQHKNRKDKDLLKDTYLIENGWTVIRINWFNPVIESNKLKLYSQIENFKNIIKL